MKKFEVVQQNVLDSKVKNQLVSAGAGSGKTTVMIEKIFNLLTKDKVDIDNLLVVTFTVLASNEMKQRLEKSIKNELKNVEDKERVYSLLEKLNTANIDTIDGFSSKTIKKYFYELEISPNIEIVSDTTRDYYMTRAMNKTLNEFSKQTDKMNILLDFFGGNRRNFDALKELIISAYNNIINIENYDEFLDKSVEEYVDGITSEQIVNSDLCGCVERLKKVIIDNYSCVSEELKKHLNSILDMVSNIDINLSLSSNLVGMKEFVKPNFSRSDQKTEEVKEINLVIKDLEQKLDEYQKNKIDTNFQEINQKVVEYYAYFIELVKIFIKNYNNIKAKNNLIDFNDLNRLMLKLLEKEEIKKELQEKFKYIFIDEYQDVNPLQDKLMSSLIGQETKLFMVGDVKQSIYGFRGSSPEWFLKKYDNLKSNSALGDVFDMNINFRSNPKILEFINQVFSSLMTKELSGIDYEKDCLIEPKRDDIIDDKVKILLVKDEENPTIASGVYSVKNDKQILNDELDKKEAFLVLKTIVELVGQDFYDANEKIIRKLTYKDIAILSRAEKDKTTAQLIEFLRSNNVPINNNNRLDTNESEGIKLVLSILKCVSASADDVDYLSAFLALTDLNLNDIIALRQKEKSLFENLMDNTSNPEIKSGFDVLEAISKARYTRSNKELIEYILNQAGVKYNLFNKPNGEKEYSKIQEFLKKISVLENSLNLFEFIEVVENSVSKGSDFLSSDSEDSVTVQTIHKSKGLEYPVVILFNSDKQFTYLTEHDAINFNAQVGLGMDYFDVENRTKHLSLPKLAIKIKNKHKGYLEELRLLYVAMTRAKNKLIITGKYSSKFFDKLDEMNKTNYRNMVLSIFADRITEGKNEFKYCDISFIDDIEKINLPQKENKEIEFLAKDFEYNLVDKTISFKNSVTGINSKKSEATRYSTKEFLATAVQYTDEENKALIGTHYHKALELLDFENEYVKNTDFDDVDYKKIKLAHEKLSNLVSGAISIRKETDFMLYLPYNDLVDNSDVEEKVLVQGVVDLLIEKQDSVILVDYKFSKLPIKVLKEKYLEQLSLYKKAIELAFNKKVEHMYIYSIETGELL